MSETDTWTTLIADVPGGPELVRYCGEVPLFHDGYVLGLDLKRKGTSTLTVHFWQKLIRDLKFSENVYVTRGDFVARFNIKDVVDCELVGFNDDNIILALRIVRAPLRSDRLPWVGHLASVDDLELQIDTSYGVAGYIRAKHISVDFDIGKPASE